MQHYVHHLPGRLRIRVAAIKGNTTRARGLESILQAKEGVATVEANPLTGSVLIHYDPAATTGEALAAIVTGDQVAAPLAQIPEGLFTERLLQRVIRSAAAHLAEMVIERAAIALLATIL